MNVSEAIASRMSCRAFLPTPVTEATVRAILRLASAQFIAARMAAS